MLPFIELRGALPFAIIIFGMDPFVAFALCVISNMIPIPFLLVYLKRAEAWLRKYPYWEKKMEWWFERTRKKAKKTIAKYEVIGLMAFVGVPLPVTGAWTGSLIAYLFDLDVKKSFFTILAGVMIAGTIIGILSVSYGYFA
jgi:uncharacterized membrane protein